MASDERIGSRFPKGHRRKLVRSDFARVLTIPRTENVPTDDQRAAIEGTRGTPSASNKFVTDDDPRLASVEPFDGCSVPPGHLGYGFLQLVFDSGVLEESDVEQGHAFVDVDTTDGAFTLNLHSASPTPKSLAIRNSGANAVSIVPEAGDNIAGAATLTLPAGSVVTLVNNGVSQWKIFGYTGGTKVGVSFVVLSGTDIPEADPGTTFALYRRTGTNQIYVWVGEWFPLAIEGGNGPAGIIP